MAAAMNLSVKAGRLAYLAGRMEKKQYAFVISCFPAGDKHFFASSSDFLRSER